MIVITGGSGFIGMHLAELLNDNGIDFKIVDLIPPKKFKERFEKVDISNFKEMKAVVSKGDTVVHLAALVNAHMSDEKMEDYFRVNVEGTSNVVKACKEVECKKIIFNSSVAVYSPQLKTKIDESAEITPQNFYGTSKVLGEEIIRLSGSPYVIFRPTNCYGRGGKGVINIFAERAKKGLPIKVWGTGKQERDFIHVKDVARVLMIAIEKGQGIYNLSYGENTSIRKISELVKKISQKEFSISFEEVSEKEIHYIVSNDKIRTELGFVPEITLEDGIRDLI